ncbi:MAG: amino acid ABC transporter ATP-binding protein [Ruminococcaceae bacterium]|nr:amino acid ABC transporter ATP-binding protein [Oscillospiraceae bacterium]
MAFLEANNIKKSFGDTQVLRGIDFSMERGEVAVIIGSSGGGKTTFLRCLNFLETPGEGTIVVGGEEIFNAAIKYTDAEKREKRLRFGLVFQSFNLFPQYTARENVAMPLKLRLFERYATGLSRREKHALKKSVRVEAYQKADEILAEVGLADKANNYPCELSGGQCQRVAIARALALSPDILCFDEPTSALDPELTGEVLRVIKSLKSGDRTMIIVTHEMAFARQVADKIVFIADGLIEEIGTPEEVFEHPKSEKLKAFLHNDEL